MQCTGGPTTEHGQQENACIFVCLTLLIHCKVGIALVGEAFMYL